MEAKIDFGPFYFQRLLRGGCSLLGTKDMRMWEFLSRAAEKQGKRRRSQDSKGEWQATTSHSAGLSRSREQASASTQRVCNLMGETFSRIFERVGLGDRVPWV